MIYIYKLHNEDKLSEISRLYMQLSYLLFVFEQLYQKGIMSVQSMNSPKLAGLLLKQLHRDKLNAISRLYMQSTYLWLDSFVVKNQESTMEGKDFDITTAHLLHFVRM